MRPIDGDALFEKAFEVWGTEADAGEKNMFIEMINNAHTIAPPPNDPLNMDELLEMDGEPVWVSTGRLSEWCIVHSCHSDDVIGGGVIMTRRTAEKRTYQYADYGKT